MEQPLCKAMLPLVNDQTMYPTLQDYIEYRIEILRGFLEKVKDPQQMFEIQGAIGELRRFQTLQEQVKTALKEMH
jgi:hypothetical protein